MMFLATDMFEFNALSQFSIALLFIYHGRWHCDLCQGQSIQGQGHKLKAKGNTEAGQSQGQGQNQGQEIWL